MIIAGDVNLLRSRAFDQYKIYNFTSYNTMSNFNALSNLNNTNVLINCIDDYDRHVTYFNYIFNHTPAFIELMTIMYDVYCGKDVLILINNDYNFPICNIMNDLLFTIIMDRYGIRIPTINMPDDIYYCDEEQNFSPLGIYNIDIDKDRYIYLLYSNNDPNIIEEYLNS